MLARPPRSRRPSILGGLLALALTVSLSACGGGDLSKEDIAAKIDDGNAGAQTFPDSADAQSQKEAQENADKDQAAAEQAIKRRKELADLEKEQREETERLMDDGVAGGNDEDSVIPIGSADPELERFRARLAGVCAGGQKRILDVSKDAEKAAKTKDPMKILAAAQAYQDALNDFMAALTRLDPPASVRADYRSWLKTINDLADNARLQVVSYADPKKSAKLAKKTESLFQELILKSATLGVTCLSATA